MIVGVPKEIKDNEYRVALTPGGAHLLVSEGHRVLVQAGAGVGSGFPDAEYAQSGAVIVPTAAEAWAAEHGDEGQGAAAGRVRLSAL